MSIVDCASRQYRIDHPMQHDPTTNPGIVEMSERVHSHMAHTDPQSSRPPTCSGEITVYWRPGCPFCSSLRSGLRRAGLTVREVNIWEDPAAAAFVRSVARGNETVPTVSVGSVNLVNPSAKKVLSVAATEAPGLLPAPPTTQRREHRRRLFSRRETTS